MQKAARLLDNLGLAAVQLSGDWSLELQWAFYQGFVNAKRQTGVQFTGDSSTLKTLEQRVQWYRFAKSLVNQTPEQLSAAATLCSKPLLLLPRLLVSAKAELSADQWRATAWPKVGMAYTRLVVASVRAASNGMRRGRLLNRLEVELRRAYRITF
ncbi:Peptidase B [Alishewanella longhuensis]